MFRFSIRELMLLTLVVGLGLAWWMDHWQQKLALERLQESQRQSEEYLGNVIKLVEGMGLSHSFKPPKK